VFRISDKSEEVDPNKIEGLELGDDG